MVDGAINPAVSGAAPHKPMRGKKKWGKKREVESAKRLTVHRTQGALVLRGLSNSREHWEKKEKFIR